MKKLLIVLVLLGLAVAGIALWYHHHREAKLEAIAYTFEVVEHGSISEVVSATGLVHPQDVFPVGCEVSGKVIAVLADCNQEVKEGEELLRVDDRLARRRLDQATAAVELARAGVKQAEANRDTAALAVKRLQAVKPEVRRQDDMDLAQSKLRSAEIGIEAARAKVKEAETAQQQAELGLRLTVVRAPVLGAAGGSSPSYSPADRPGTGVLAQDGAPSGDQKRSFIVLDRKVTLGQEIGPPASAHLFTLVPGLERVQILAHVGESDITKVRRGLKARFTLAGAAEGQPSHSGEVKDVRLMPGNEHGAVYYKVHIDAANQRDPAGNDWLIRPGMTAAVDIIRRTHQDVWKLPAAALNFQPPPSVETEAARAKLDRWHSIPNREQWQVVWVSGPEHKPWPLFVRTGGRDAHGDTGIQDGQFIQVLEWDPELQPPPDPKNPGALQVITGMPPPKKLFSMPSFKF